MMMQDAEVDVLGHHSRFRQEIPLTLLITAHSEVAGGLRPFMIAQIYNWYQAWPAAILHMCTNGLQ